MIHKYAIWIIAVLSSALYAEEILMDTAVHLSEAKVIGQLKKGAQVKVLKRGAKWTEISYETDAAFFEGYVRNDAIGADVDGKAPEAASVTGKLIKPKCEVIEQSARYWVVFDFTYTLETKLPRIQEPETRVYLFVEKANTTRWAYHMRVGRNTKREMATDAIQAQAAAQGHLYRISSSFKKGDKVLAWRLELIQGDRILAVHDSTPRTELAKMDIPLSWYEMDSQRYPLGLLALHRLREDLIKASAMNRTLTIKQFNAL